MSAYATAAELSERYPDLEAGARADALLSDASDAIDMAFRSRGRTVPYEAGDELLLREARRVCCQLAARELTRDAARDVTQSTVTAGPFSQTFSFGDGANLRLNRADLQALGLGGGAAGFAG